MNTNSEGETGICRFCGEEFIKRVYWQRDCSPPKACHRLQMKREREVGRAALNAAGKASAA